MTKFSLLLAKFKLKKHETSLKMFSEVEISQHRKEFWGFDTYLLNSK